MNGWMIEVETERMGGGKPLREIYAAHDPDEGQSVALVKARAKVQDSKVFCRAKVPEAVLKALEVPVGECRLVHAIW